MTWDELLERLESRGRRPEEIDFMENYGPLAARRYPSLEGRHLRCIYGAVRIDGHLDFDAYVFPSSGDAEDFHRLVESGPGWHRAGNVVFWTDPGHLEDLRAAVD